VLRHSRYAEHAGATEPISRQGKNRRYGRNDLIRAARLPHALRAERLRTVLGEGIRMRTILGTRGSRTTAAIIMAVGLIAGCHSHQKHHQQGDEGQLTMNDLPSTVQSHFHRDYPAASIKGIGKETEDGVTHYEIKYIDRNGDERKIEYNREGDEIKDADAK
jgi:hypothetical protein